MPAPRANSPLARVAEYDLEAGVRHDFLNRVIDLALRAGILPSRFETTLSAVDGSLGLVTRTVLSIHIIKAKVFATAGADRTIGISCHYEGLIDTTVVLDEWNITTPAGVYNDPGLNERFLNPFAGNFSATGILAFQELEDVNVLVIKFDQLVKFDLHNIGDLQLGADLNTHARLIFERICMMTMRTRFKFPKINGLPGALPVPLRELLDNASGQIGLIDIKIVGGDPAPDPDETHVLLQTRQNLGKQSYADVKSFDIGDIDFGAALTYRWLRQIQQYLWTGDAIPHQFNDQGKPDANGKVFILSVAATFFTSTIQVKTRMQREVIGLPLSLDALIEVKPEFQNGVLHVTLINSSIDLGLGWARAAGWTVIFFVLRDIFVRLLLRALNVLIEPWATSQLQKFIDSHEIDFRRHVKWTGTPFTVDILPAAIDVKQQQALVGLKFQVHSE